jgi:hypothetical protein
VHVPDDYIYFKTGTSIPAAITDGSPWIFRNATGTLTGPTNNTLVYAKYLSGSAKKLQFSTTSGGTAINITATTSGNVTLNFPYVYNNILNTTGIYPDQQAVKYYTDSTPLTGLASGSTYYLKSSNAGLVVPALYSLTGSTHTFTSAGVTGGTGPTIAALRTAYSTTWGATYLNQGNYQGYQDWTVPASGVYELTVAGAPGRASASSSGGAAPIVKGRVSLIRGEVITIVVGQRGAVGADTNWPGASGGTFVVRKTGNVPLLIAGGGASASYNAGTPANPAITTNGAGGTYSGGTTGNGGTGGAAGGAGGGFLSSGRNSTEGSGGVSFQAGLVGGAPSGQ